jgi:hypothetical protein
MTPDKNFKMKSSYKGILALMKGSKEDRSHMKKMFIDAQLHEEAARRAALKSKDRSKDSE